MRSGPFSLSALSSPALDLKGAQAGLPVAGGGDERQGALARDADLAKVRPHAGRDPVGARLHPAAEPLDVRTALLRDIGGPRELHRTGCRQAVHVRHHAGADAPSAGRDAGAQGLEIDRAGSRRRVSAAASPRIDRRRQGGENERNRKRNRKRASLHGLVSIPFRPPACGPAKPVYRNGVVALGSVPIPAKIL